MKPDERTGIDAQAAAAGFFGGVVARPVGLLVGLVTLLVVSAIAYARLPLQFLPGGWTAPYLGMWLPNADSTPQENERRVAQVVEEQLRTLAGIDQITSESDEDGVQIEIEFDAHTDMDYAKAEVRDRIERARPRLPETVERIQVWTEDGSSIPVAWIGILYPHGTERTDFLMDTVVRPRLEAVSGVGRVSFWGLGQDSVRILLDEERVLAARLDLGSVIRRLAGDNFAQPLGEVVDGGREVLLRSDMRFADAEEIGDFPVGNGLRLRDLGRVSRVKSVRDWVSRIDGDYAYFCMVEKDSQANVVDTSHALVAAIEELNGAPELEGELEFIVFGTQGEIIEETLGQLRSATLWGGLLAVVVLLVFLRRIRLTLCVALSIPISALLALALEYFRGSSFNVLTMMGITLAIGMLVDNSIVVVENSMRLRALGLPARAATAAGTREIALAITLATLTTVVVFLPLIFLSDHPILQIVFGSIGIPLCTSLLFSLLVALVFLPVVAARSLGERPRPVQALAALLAPVMALPVRGLAHVIGGLRLVGYGCTRVLFRCMRGTLAVLAPWQVRAALSVGILALAAWRCAEAVEGLAVARALGPFGGASGSYGVLVSTFVVPALFAVAILWLGPGRWRRRPVLPPPRPASFTPAGTGLVEMLVQFQGVVMAWTLRHRLGATAVFAAALASVVIPNSRLELGGLGEEESTTSLGFDVDLEENFTLSEAAEELWPYEAFLEARRAEYGFDHWRCWFATGGGDFEIYWDERQTAEKLVQVREELKRDLPQQPGHTLYFSGSDENRAATTDSRRVAAFALRGQDSTQLEELGAKAVRILEGVTGIEKVQSPLQDSPEQVRVVVDRELAHALGVNAEIAFENISWALRGVQLPRFHDEGREIPFLIEYDEERLAGLSTLRDLPVYTGTGSVQLSTIADIGFVPGQRQIHRRNGWTSFVLQAEIAEGKSREQVEADGYAALAALELPRGYSWGIDESALARQSEEFAALRKAFALSVVLVLLLMGILFESVLLPVAVLFTIPYAVVGALWALFLTGTSMDFMAWIGMIILAGVVVNNGIVLVDQIHRLRSQGLERAEAVMLGCAHRVRPVLMTALTTIVGLIPTILSEAATNSFDYRALATCMAGGLTVSTLFTLWVVPLAYTVIDDFWLATKARFAWWMRLPAARMRRRAALDAP